MKAISGLLPETDLQNSLESILCKEYLRWDRLVSHNNQEKYFRFERDQVAAIYFRLYSREIPVSWDE